jgi:hypothetical protein
MSRRELSEWIIIFGLNAGEDYDFERGEWRDPPKTSEK